MQFVIGVYTSPDCYDPSLTSTLLRWWDETNKFSKSVVYSQYSACLVGRLFTTSKRYPSLHRQQRLPPMPAEGREPCTVLLCSGRAHLSSTVRSRAKSINDTRHRHILHTVAAAHRRWIINNYVYETFGCFSPCFPIPSPSPSGASATAASKVDAFFELCSLLLCPSGRCPRGVSFCFVVAK